MFSHVFHPVVLTGMQVLKFSFSHLYQNSRDSYHNNVIENLF